MPKVEHTAQFRIRQWGSKAALTLADQGLFSGATFMASILLARWLPAEAYGAFALSFSIFLILASLHTSLLTEPMLVLGAARFQAQFRAYLGFLLIGHAAISMAGALLLALAAWLLGLNGSAQVAEALLGVGLAAPLILLPWLLRRAFYIEARPGWAAAASTLYLLATLGGLLALHAYGLLSPLAAYLVLGAASLLVSILLIVVLRPARPRRADSAEMLRSQWSYARWSSLSAILIWVPLNIFYVAIPYAAGLAGAAALRALANLLTPLTQSTQAIIVLLLPPLSRLHQEQGQRALARRVRSILLTFLALSALYWIALALFRGELLGLLYANQYSDLAALLPLAGLIPVVMGASSVLGSGLRAMEAPQRVVRAYVWAAAFAASGGIWATLQFGVAGALIGQGLTYLVMAILLGRQFTRAVSA